MFWAFRLVRSCLTLSNWIECWSIRVCSVLFGSGRDGLTNGEGGSGDWLVSFSANFFPASRILRKSSVLREIVWLEWMVVVNLEVFFSVWRGFRGWTGRRGARSGRGEFRWRRSVGAGILTLLPGWFYNVQMYCIGWRAVKGLGEASALSGGSEFQWIVGEFLFTESFAKVLSPLPPLCGGRGERQRGVGRTTANGTELSVGPAGPPSVTP